MDYRAAYDLIMELQATLSADHDDPLLGGPDYLKVKALAATYELQGYLASRIADDLKAIRTVRKSSELVREEVGELCEEDIERAPSMDQQRVYPS